MLMGSAGEISRLPTSSMVTDVYRVSLWNPYGIDEVYDLEAIWPWIWGVHMFADMSEQPRKGKTG